MLRSLDAPGCRRRSLLDRLRAFLRHDAGCGDWFEDLPPDSFVREPRRPVPPSPSGSVALEPPPPDLAQPSAGAVILQRVKPADKCTCEKPVLQEHSDQKGSSTSWCGRCKRPLSLRVALFRSAFA